MKSKKAGNAFSRHVCIGCGICCRNFAYIRLTPDDIKTLEAFTGLYLEAFTDEIDKGGEKRFMKFQDNGDCIFLIMVDGAYSCSVYEARPSTCKGYPATDIQRETCRVNSGR